MSLRGAPSPRVALPAGDIYPSIPVHAPDAGVQSTARPPGWLFRGSSGFPSVRVGRPGYMGKHEGAGGLGIGFTTLRYAEDITAYDNPTGIPAIVDQDKIPADIADIPGSEYLGVDGMLDETAIAQNKGPYHGRTASTLNDDGRSALGHDPHDTLPDMGDRSPSRPLTRAYWTGYIKNPTTMFRQEWHDNHWVALGIAALGVGLAYVVGSDFERIWAKRRSNSPVHPLTEDVVDKPVKTVATAPVAAVETAGKEAERATDAAAAATHDAANAVKEAGEAVSDAVTDVAKAATD